MLPDFIAIEPHTGGRIDIFVDASWTTSIIIFFLGAECFTSSSDPPVDIEFFIKDFHILLFYQLNLLEAVLKSIVKCDAILGKFHIIGRF